MKDFELKDTAEPQNYLDTAKMDRLLAKLRKEDPVAYVQNENYPPFWLITKVADMIEIESKPEIFKASPSARLLPKIVEEGFRKRATGNEKLLTYLDDPEHAKYAEAWNVENPICFNRQKLKEASIEIVRDLMTEMALYKTEYGECDFIGKLTSPFRWRSQMNFVGLPQNKWETFFKILKRFTWTKENLIKNGVFDSSIPDAAKKELAPLLTDLINDRRAHPQEDFATVMAKSLIDGKPPSEEQIFIWLTIQAEGSLFNVEDALTQAIKILAEKPNLLQQIQNNLSLIPFFVQEVLRWVNPPSKILIRTAISDYEIRGKKIKAGDKVGICYTSLNRDEEVIEDPFTFRIDRKPNRHFTFGHGIHRCPGTNTGNILMCTFLEEFIPQFTYLEVLSSTINKNIMVWGRYSELMIKYQMKKSPM